MLIRQPTSSAAEEGHPVRTYQFLFFDRRGRSPALDFVECADDRDAARSADRHLGLHATCSGVEVFDGDRMVVRLDRPVDRHLAWKPAIRHVP